MREDHTSNTTSSTIKWGVRKKILIIFAAFSIICLVSILGIVGGFFAIIQATTTNQSKSALTTQIQRNMQKSAAENALVIQGKFATAMDDVERLKIYTENVFNNPGQFGTRPSYNDTDMTAPGLNLQLDTYYQRWVSFNYSCYHLAPEAYNGSYTNTTASVANLVNLSANLDTAFQMLKRSNPNYAWVYVGFAAGIHRCYPWHTYVTDYDPRVRPWYIMATANPGMVNITAPYVDASGLGVMVTIAKTVSYSNGTMIGVAALDLTINAIRSSILNIKLLQTGYAFLIDTHGKTVAYNTTIPLNTDITALEPISDALLLQMGTFSNGTGSVVKNGQNYYLSYSRVNNTDFVLVNMVPEAEVFAAVDELVGNINVTSLAVSAGTTIIIAIAVIVSIIIGAFIARKITLPVQRLTDVVHQLTRQDLSATLLKPGTDLQIDSQLESQDDELGDLTRAFKKMLDRIRDGARKDSTAMTEQRQSNNLGAGTTDEEVDHVE